MADLAEKIVNYQGHLAEIRQPYEAMIDDVITFVNHSRRKISEKSTKGNKTGTEVYDGTPILAKNLLVDGLVGYDFSRNSRWYTFTLPTRMNFARTSGMRHWSGKRMDEVPEVAKWLQDCADVGYGAFNSSNFYDVIPEFVGDGASIGTAHMIIEEDIRSGRIVFTIPHFRECYIAENRWGRVDTLYRKYKLTLKQLVEKFSYDKMIGIDNNFKKSFEDNIHQEREVIHAIYPRVDFNPTSLNSKNKPIASVWVYLSGNSNTGGKGKLLEESGYDWMPNITWRWRKNSDEWYGRSPAWDAFVDIKLANQQGRTNLIAGHKMADPPMAAFGDLRNQVNVSPGGWTFLPTGLNRTLQDSIPRPIQTGIQLPFSVEAQERTEKIIREHFHTDFFLMLYQAAMNKVEITATQAMEMMGEKAAVLGTRIGMLHSEASNPILDRVFDIEMKAGRMPDPPQILQDLGGKVEIDYIGPLAQAQMRLTESRSIQAGLTMLGQIATIKPEAMDMVDWDESVKASLNATGFPAKLIRSPEMIQAIRQMRQQQMAQAAQLEALPKVAKAAQAASKEVQDGSVLSGMMGESANA